MNTALPKNYIILGPPGSGKSTQATILKKKLGLTHIDIGGELRRLAESDTDLGVIINEVINIKKELVSDGLIGDVIAHILKSLPEESGVLIDGAPRRVSQIDEVVEALQQKGRSITRVIFLMIPLEVAVERISRRWLCLSCQAPYIDAKEGNSCTICGESIGQRKDDTPLGVEKRYRVFMEETLPVVEYFESKNLLIHLDASLPSEEISHILQEQLTEVV